MDKNVMDGGEAILQGCRDLGLDYLISSPGSDWGSLWEALARQKVNGVKGPGYLSCGHETLAVNLAMGYTYITGRMQGVVLHAGVGLLQGSMGIHGARQAEIPMLVVSGESQTFGDQEGFDPGGQWYNNHNNVGGLQRFLDPVVKWSHQVPSVSNVYELVMRAGEMAQVPPIGPTYLDVPIEVMMAKWPQPAKMRKAPPPGITRPADSDIQKVADMLLAAKNPVLTTAAAGRTVAGHDALVALCDLLALPVVEGGSAEVTNFPKEHPLHQGFEGNALLREADLVIVAKSRTPWYPANLGPVNAKVVIIDDAPFKIHMAYQNLQADAYLTGDVTTTLRLLTEAVKASKIDASKVNERRSRWTAAHNALEQRYRNAEKEARGKKGIQAVTLCATLAEALPANTVYTDETTVHGGLNRRHVANRGTNSYLAVRSGLGQGLGVALGIKLAMRDRPVCTLIGDGAFLYNPSVQAFGFARDEKLPTMTVVYNNGGYRAMRLNQASYYPDGAGVKHNLFYGEPINGFAFEELPRLFGGVGFRVEDPAELKGVLQKAAAAVADGKSAVVNVILAE